MKTSPRLKLIAALLFSLAILIYILVLGLTLSVEADGIIHFVKPEGTGSCGNWTTACDLQTALSKASYGDQIWVAQGIYTPTSSNDRTATFRLVFEVEVYGGFAGTEESLEQRDWETHITVLSGDIEDNDIKDPNGIITDTANIIGDNSYHVVTATGLIYTAVLDGFIITGGNANMSPNATVGGGLYNDNSHTTLANVIFSGNNALYGGGIYNDHGGPTLTNVAFNGNSAVMGGGLLNDFVSGPSLTNVAFNGNSAVMGGGMLNDFFSSPRLTNVTFSKNIATEEGGGMSNYEDSFPRLTNVTFIGNQSTKGGGMYSHNSNPELLNVIFNGNTADLGGGIMNSESSPPLTNVTFSGNIANDGGGMYNEISDPELVNVTFSSNSAAGSGGGIYNFASSSPSINNTIFWINEASIGPQIFNENNGSSPTLDYSLIEGGCPEHAICINIKIANPKFVRDPNNGSGDWTTRGKTDYGDLRLQLTSPAIDAGNNTAIPDTVTFDLDGKTRFVDIEDVVDTGNGRPPIIDMGAYEARLKTIFMPTILSDELN